MRWDRQNQFVIAGFVIAGFVSIYFTEILLGFQMLFVITGSSLKRGFTVYEITHRSLCCMFAMNCYFQFQV